LCGVRVTEIGMPRIHRLKSRNDGTIVCARGQNLCGDRLAQRSLLTSVENHADKDGTEEKVELKIALVLLPREAVPCVGAVVVSGSVF